MSFFKIQRCSSFDYYISNKIVRENVAKQYLSEAEEHNFCLSDKKIFPNINSLTEKIMKNCKNGIGIALHTTILNM